MEHSIHARWCDLSTAQILLARHSETGSEMVGNSPTNRRCQVCVVCVGVSLVSCLAAKIDSVPPVALDITIGYSSVEHTWWINDLIYSSPVGNKQ
jgi:hypothetical protein